MKNPFCRTSSFYRNESGQAVVEYLLMLAVIVAIVGAVGIGFRKILVKLWEKMARDIAAPCPGCPPPPDVRIR
jgi:Flp pilus assembly pilin Flp